MELAGFEIDIRYGDLADQAVLVDIDSFSQVMINLVDNAIKFSKAADKKYISISAEHYGKSNLIFKVRDYGPGIPNEQLKKIFKLFYRPQDELTRETMGTGIGLALVHQLIAAMGRSVYVVNKEQGAEFRIILPIENQPFVQEKSFK